jgi:ankyrin repeat protein
LPLEGARAASSAAARLADRPSAAQALALQRAAAAGNVPELQVLMAQKANMNARDSSGRTALMLAVLHGQRSAVDTLIAAGADPNAADSQGRTPLKAALEAGQPEIVAALRRAGAR